MAQGERTGKRGVFGTIFGLINPVRDPSLLVAIILTVIFEGGSHNPAAWIGYGLLFWMAVKAFIWLLVNFAFSFVYLIRKSVWVSKHPRLAWRLLDALGTEEIIIGGLRPDMFTTEDGSLHEGDLAYAGLGAGRAGGLLSGRFGQPYPDAGDGYQDYGELGREPRPSIRLDEHTEELQELLTNYSRLIADWMAFTEEKWRAVSDSQLGWKPLRGRWNGWEEIYADSFASDDENAVSAQDPMQRRFENSQQKGSAASAVACFMRDLDKLRSHLVALENEDVADAARLSGFSPQQPVSQRTGKSSIIRNPMIVDAD